MAALNGGQIVLLYSAGLADAVALFAIRKASTGDTAQLSQWFTAIKQCAILGATYVGVAQGAISASTVVTMPATFTDEAAYMLVWGCSAATI